MNIGEKGEIVLIRVHQTSHSPNSFMPWFKIVAAFVGMGDLGKEQE